ncbi:NUDIX hydrolase [Chlorobium sp. N1]|uniref:NUDIX hydrolase n=1 Tax=Chlorobium sp. N1 TaxID=2491138 RepID=UPI00103E9ED4|nr:NUDIX hydrolase [Chlorobium sp. N1]TCD47331.1 NUDIX hydrolase [Chlorobium sp. N1]
MAVKARKTIEQSGVIPIFEDRVVLVTSRKTRRWIFPKGYVGKGLSPVESAAREALEEAGLVGSIDGAAAGSYRYRKQGRSYSVQIFPFFVESMLEEWDEMGQRQRVVVPPLEAIDMLVHDDLRAIVSTYFNIGVELQRLRS